jgi:hypothetical protein
MAFRRAVPPAEAHPRPNRPHPRPINALHPKPKPAAPITVSDIMLTVAKSYWDMRRFSLKMSWGILNYAH